MLEDFQPKEGTDNQVETTRNRTQEAGPLPRQKIKGRLRITLGRRGSYTTYAPYQGNTDKGLFLYPRLKRGPTLPGHR